MSLFAIDEKKCKKDFICVEECPLGIIEAISPDSVPKQIEDAEKFCISCGHCVAVCPHGAFSHKKMKPEDCIEIESKDKGLSFNQIEKFLYARRSIRKYKDKTVDKEKIIKLIDTAKYAPSGHNSQPVKWLVIYDKDKVHELASLTIDWMQNMLQKKPEFAVQLSMDKAVEKWNKGLDPICRNAPHVVFVYAEKDNRMAPAACTIAMTYFELAAYAAGLGTCWAGYLNTASIFWPPLQKALNLSDKMSCFGAMMFGMPKYKYKRVPLRKEPDIKWI